MRISRETFRDIRDTIGWGTVIIWAGISVHDMKFKPEAEAKPPGVMRDRDDFVPLGFTQEEWKALKGEK